MTQYFSIHPVTPQQRLINQINDILTQGGVIVYPTDSGYALGCAIGKKEAADRIKRIRGLKDKHHFTLMLANLSELGQFAKVHNSAFRILKANTPGPYTFILQASRQVPKRLLHPKRKTVGLRIPDNAIDQAVLKAHGEPFLSVSLIMPGDDKPLTDPQQMYDRLKGRVEVVIDGGMGDSEPTSVVDLTEEPTVIRQGLGDVSHFL